MWFWFCNVEERHTGWKNVKKSNECGEMRDTLAVRTNLFVEKYTEKKPMKPEILKYRMRTGT